MPDTLGLESQAISYMTWVLVTEPKSSVRVVHSLNPQIISPVSVGFCLFVACFVLFVYMLETRALVGLNLTEWVRMIVQKAPGI